MIDISYTCHTETRMQQRAIRKRDLPFIRGSHRSLFLDARR